MEATVDALEATIRGQEQELNRLRSQRDILQQKLERNEASTSKWLQSLGHLRSRFVTALQVLQVCKQLPLSVQRSTSCLCCATHLMGFALLLQEEENPMNQESAPSIVRSLHYAHAAFLSSMQATITTPLQGNGIFPSYGTSADAWLI